LRRRLSQAPNEGTSRIATSHAAHRSVWSQDHFWYRFLHRQS